MSGNYSAYKDFKNLLNYSEDDIDFIYPLSIDIMTVTHKEKINLLKIVASFLMVYNFPNLFSKTKKQSILFTNAYNRAEYVKFLGLIRNNIPDSTYVHLKNVDLIPYLNILVIFSSFAFIYKKLRSKTSFKNIIFLASRLCFYRNTVLVLKELEKTDNFSYRKYVAFNGQYGIEALLVQFFKARKVPTLTLSHGKTYVNYKNIIPPDVINGENISAGKILTWGTSGRKELIDNFSVPPDKVIAAGNPTYPAKKIEIRQTFKNGIILLGRKIYDSGNTDILKIAAELSRKNNIKFSVRLHPSLSLSAYSKICNENNLALISRQVGLQDMFLRGQYDFAIVNNSTTYYESMYHNMVCFRYEPDENEQYEGLDDKFNDLNSLGNRIQIFKEMMSETLNESISKLLSDNLGMGINLYKDILDTP